MEALKDLMAEEWHGRKGKNGGEQSAVCHWASLTCRLKKFLIKQQTSSLYHSCSLFQAVLGQPHRVRFFFSSLFLCGWRDGEESGTHDPELEFHYPQTFSASSASSAGHVNDDGVDAAATAGVPPVLLPCPPHPSTEGQPERRHVQNCIYFCFVFWLRTLPLMTTTMMTTTTKKRANAFFTFLDNFQSNVSLLSLDWRQYNSCMGLSQAPVSFLPDSFRLLYEMYARLHTDTIVWGDSAARPWGCSPVSFGGVASYV